MTCDFNHVFRWNTPAGWKGQLVRVVARQASGRWPDGSLYVNAGDGLVTVERHDGARLVVSRSAVILADSKLGRQTLARVARGDTTPQKAARKR